MKTINIKEIVGTDVRSEKQAKIRICEDTIFLVSEFPVSKLFTSFIKGTKYLVY